MGKSTRIRYVDARKALRLIADLADLPAGTGEREALLLQRLSADLGTPVAMLFRVEGTSPGASVSFASYDAYGLDPERAQRMDDYARDGGAEDPMIPRLARQVDRAPVGATLVTGRPALASDAEWYSLDHVMEMRRFLDFNDFLQADRKLDASGRVISAALHRSWRDPPFGERERAFLRLVWEEVPRLLGWVEPEPSPRFTPREAQVAQLVVKGLTNKRVAAVLGISPETVKEHLGSIYRKAEVSNRTELATFLR